jgi:hypothetical protein
MAVTGMPALGPVPISVAPRLSLSLALICFLSLALGHSLAILADRGGRERGRVWDGGGDGGGGDGGGGGEAGGSVEQAAGVGDGGW